MLSSVPLAINMSCVYQIIQAHFFHYMPQIFNRLLLCVTYSFTLSIKLPHYSQVKLMLFSACFLRTASLLSYVFSSFVRNQFSEYLHITYHIAVRHYFVSF